MAHLVGHRQAEAKSRVDFPLGGGLLGCIRQYNRLVLRQTETQCVGSDACSSHRRADPQALEELMPLVYDELRRVARAYMRRQRAGQTLQPTALANEAYLRLVGAEGLGCKNRTHFYAVAAQMMRRILVDATRARCAAKRDAGALRVTFND
jgi:RNA polymerase sigma factor (TIGR02999 family)